MRITRTETRTEKHGTWLSFFLLFNVQQTQSLKSTIFSTVVLDIFLPCIPIDSSTTGITEIGDKDSKGIEMEEQQEVDDH